MDKEQLIRELKYIKEKHKNDKLFTFDTDISAMCSDVLDVLSRCVEIPDNVTNGDVIQTMFPNVDFVTDVFGGFNFPKWWWNSQYK